MGEERERGTFVKNYTTCPSPQNVLFFIFLFIFYFLFYFILNNTAHPNTPPNMRIIPLFLIYASINPYNIQTTHASPPNPSPSPPALSHPYQPPTFHLHPHPFPPPLNPSSKTLPLRTQQRIPRSKHAERLAYRNRILPLTSSPSYTPAAPLESMYMNIIETTNIRPPRGLYSLGPGYASLAFRARCVRGGVPIAVRLRLAGGGRVFRGDGWIVCRGSWLGSNLCSFSLLNYLFFRGQRRKEQEIFSSLGVVR